MSIRSYNIRLDAKMCPQFSMEATDSPAFPSTRPPFIPNPAMTEQVDIIKPAFMWGRWVGVGGGAKRNLCDTLPRSCNRSPAAWLRIRAYTLSDYVMKWKRFPRHWPFVRGIHPSPVDSFNKGPVIGRFMLSRLLALTGCRKTVELTAIWEVMTLMWSHCNV